MKLGLHEIGIQLCSVHWYLGCERFHPEKLCGAEEGARWPAHSNLRTFGGAAQALAPLHFQPREECVSENLSTDEVTGTMENVVSDKA